MPTCGFSILAARRAGPPSFPLTRDVGLLVLQRFVRAFKATQPLLDVSPNWRYGQAMSTKYRFREKYRIELRERDHPATSRAPHGNGVDMVISLETVTVTQGRAPAKVMQEALAWVAANQADLLKEWMKWHR